MWRYVLGVVTGCVLAGLCVWMSAGEAAQGAPAPTGYTLADIYEFIVTNGGTVPLEGDHSLYAAGAPLEGGMPTLAEIMAALRARLPCRGGGGALPATGQTKCYDVDGGEIPCDSADYPGQDGFYQAGCPMEGRFIDNGDGTVTDTCTGLMWQRDTGDTNGDGGITFRDRLVWQQALKYCDDLEFAGHGDWRLPNIRELLSIVDYCCWYPAIPLAFTAVSSWYWSSSTSAGDPADAWSVGFRYGDDSDGSAKTYRRYVRAVRGGP